MSDPIIIFDVVQFRAFLPAFANSTTYPTETLQMYWNAATCYISDKNFGWLKNDCRREAIDYMAAHLLFIAAATAGGQIPGLVQNATIDKISVGFTPPPIKNQWQWWLSLSPYGQSLWALLQVNSAGGFYIGGSPEISALRKVGGRY